LKYEKSIISPLEKANETFGTAFKIHVIKSAQNITEPHAFGLLAGGAKNFQYLPPRIYFVQFVHFLYSTLFFAQSQIFCAFFRKNRKILTIFLNLKPVSSPRLGRRRLTQWAGDPQKILFCISLE